MIYCKILIFLVVAVISAQEKQFVTFLSDEVQITQESNNATLTLPFEILKGYHIQLEKVEDDNLLATKIIFENQPYIKIIHKEFTSLQFKTVVLDKNEIQVLDKAFKINVKLKLVANKEQQELRGKLFYQTCDDFKCYFPRELKFIIPLEKNKDN